MARPVGGGIGHGPRLPNSRQTFTAQLTRRLEVWRTVKGRDGYRRPGSQRKPWPAGAGKGDARGRSRAATAARGRSR